MGVMIVRRDFAEQNPDALSAFMDEYKASTEYVNNNIPEAAALIEQYGIMASAALAEQAIPNCNIVYIDGQQMIDQISPFYQILFDSNPKSIGGTLPDDAFLLHRAVVLPSHTPKVQNRFRGPLPKHRARRRHGSS